VPIIDTSTVLSAVLRVYGGKILFEKPGFLTPRALDSFVNLFPDSFDRTYVAFNRVFYPSVLAVKNFIRENKPLSAHMDMSEWVSGLATKNFPISVLERWGIANSIHMLSVMFALFPNIKLERRNRVFPSQLLWHPTGDTFYGIFMSQDKDMYLSYQANWVGAGRFSINLNFRHISFKLSPLQNLERSHNYIDSSSDHFDATKFKIGFHEMVKDFLGQNTTIQENCNIKVLAKCLDVAEQVFFYDTTK